VKIVVNCIQFISPSGEKLPSSCIKDKFSQSTSLSIHLSRDIFALIVYIGVASCFVIVTVFPEEEMAWEKK
jgi:hypothetical protein